MPDSTLPPGCPIDEDVLVEEERTLLRSEGARNPSRADAELLLSGALKKRGVPYLYFEKSVSTESPPADLVQLLRGKKVERLIPVRYKDADYYVATLNIAGRYLGETVDAADEIDVIALVEQRYIARKS